MHDRVLLGRYRLIEQLGQGGMGSVWRAQDLTLHTLVAVKLIDPAIAESSEILERFQREALAAAELRSTHIVQVIDYGVDEGTPFIAMELLEGESLGTRIDRVGAMSLDDISRILSQVARALSRAHEKGIVHRDLKPDNIFIVSEGDEEVVKVLDFGIAKKLDALSVSSSTKTRTGALLGTPYYMSPEQALGRRNIDHRTDIWSMAVIAYECLTAIRPFDSESVGALLMSICHEPIPTPSSVAAVHPGFDAWFARAAAREPDDRFQTAVEAAAALRAIANGQAPMVALGPVRNALVLRRDDPVAMLETISNASVTIPGRARRKAQTTRVRWVLAALGLTAAITAVLWQRSVSPPPTAPAPAASAFEAKPTVALPPKTSLGATVSSAPVPSQTPSPSAETPAQRVQNNASSPPKAPKRASRRHENPAGF